MELEKTIWYSKKKHPINPSLKSFITLDAWRENTPSFVITERESLLFKRANNIFKDRI
jgi:hypothetical protein